MNKEEKLIRSYFKFNDINQTEPIEVLPLTLVDMLLEYGSQLDLEEMNKRTDEELKNISDEGLHDWLMHQRENMHL